MNIYSFQNSKKLIEMGITGPEGHLQSRPEEVGLVIRSHLYYIAIFVHIFIHMKQIPVYTVFTLMNAPGRRHYFSDFTDFTLNFSDFTLKTPIFNKMCLFDDEKVNFEHI